MTTRSLTVRQRLKRASQATTFAGASNALFGGVTDRFKEDFEPLQEDLEEANVKVLFRTYVSQMFTVSTLMFLLGIGISINLALFAPFPLVAKVALLFMLAPLMGIGTFIVMYLYPSWKANQRAADIKMNLPFALNHMSAIAGSGVPPSSMFSLLVNFDEYGEISAEAEKVVTKVDAFGEDVTTAVREVAKETPSGDLQEVFYGIVATIETGGSLQAFLEESADRALFDYRIEREKQINRLTTFASFYTALLVAAPLFLIVILAILEVIGGSLFGMPIRSTCGIIGALLGECPMGVIDVGAYFIIPIANILFITILGVTQPEI